MKTVSVRSVDWLPSLVHVPFLCLEIGKACPSSKEGSTIGYDDRVIEVSKITLTTLAEAHLEN